MYDFITILLYYAYFTLNQIDTHMYIHIYIPYCFNYYRHYYDNTYSIINIMI
jgi:hypothetical protein